MLRFLMLAIAAAVCPYTLAAPLSAIMTFESRVVTPEGVTKTTYFQERFIRDDNQVWSQRIVPRTEASHDRESSHAHKHNVNFALAGKWVTRASNSEIKFQFVRTEDKTIVVPRVSEYGTLGFDGRWETAYYLLDPAILLKMRKLTEPAPKNARWYESRNAEMFTRILWDEERLLPLSIETGSLDGSTDNKIRVQLAAMPEILPWEALAGYESTAYEDLLD